MYIQYIGCFKRPIVHYINVYRNYDGEYFLGGPVRNRSSAIYRAHANINGDCIGRWKVTLK